MTFRQIMESDKDFLIPKDVADVLGCQPYTINCQAKADPAKLGFPVCMMGTNVRIPRLAFIHWMRFGNAAIRYDENNKEALNT